MEEQWKREGRQKGKAGGKDGGKGFTQNNQILHVMVLHCLWWIATHLIPICTSGSLSNTSVPTSMFHWLPMTPICSHFGTVSPSVYSGKLLSLPTHLNCPNIINPTEMAESQLKPSKSITTPLKMIAEESELFTIGLS